MSSANDFDADADRRRSTNQSRRHHGSDAGMSSGLTRVTINLTARARAALTELVDADNTNKTDAVNRAIRLACLLRRYTDHTGVITVTAPDGRRIDIDVA
nr:hypothetical protein [Micromonospora sp. DSM 115978]